MSENEYMPLTREIAKHLSDVTGDTWRAEDEHKSTWGTSLVNDGMKLWLSYWSHGKGKGIKISGSVPAEMREHLRYNEQAPEIGVSRNRPALTIAREINRRLLPLFGPLLATLRERKAGMDQRDSEQETLTAELAARLGPIAKRRQVSNEYGRQRDDRWTIEIGRHYDGPIWGEIVTRYDGAAELTLRLDSEMARALCDCIARLTAPSSKP